MGESKLLITVGSGGVGKTTVSALCGIKSAQNNFKTLVITIDPAKRLANALGLKSLCSTPEPVPKYENLSLMMLDLGAAWDDMVLRIYGDGDKAKQIFNNRFYHYLSRELAGSQELIAGEALLELYESGGYEKIVLDTPPSIHAIDFLEAPERIIGFLANETVLGFLNKHGKNLSEKGSKWVASAGGMLQSVVQKIIGKGFFLELVDFFVLLQDLIKPLTERTKRFQELIKSQACEFQIIFSPEPNSIREAEVLQAKLDEKNYRISRLVANRVLPKFDGVAVDPGSHSAVRDDVRRILEQHEQKFDYEQELLGEFKNNKTSLICLEALACDIQSEEGMSKLLAGLDK